MFSLFLHDQSRMDPIVNKAVRNSQKDKIDQISKMALRLECKGDPVPIASIILTSYDVIESEIVMESSS